MLRVSSIVFSLALLFSASIPVFSQETNEETPQVLKTVILKVTSGRARKGPSTSNEIIREYPIGSKFNVREERNGWSKVVLKELSEDKEEETGWISNTITEEYSASRPGVQFQRIADSYLGRKNLSFSAAKELYEYLPKAADDAKTFEVGGDLRLKSLEALSIALRKIPFGKSESNPYKAFLEKHKDDVVYSEPAGEWYVKADVYWQLHERYKKYKVAEQIAWKAAATPLPGECEGYINCYLYNLRVTQGEYLNFYPGGKFSKEAVLNMQNLLQPIVADSRSKTSYYTSNDISDRAEFNKWLADLRKIVSRTPHVEKQTVLQQIVVISENYR